MDNLKKIGLFGGCFNPVHIGHLRAAEEIKDILFLDKIVFIPTFIHPQKKKKGMVEAKHRFKMLKLATEDNSNFEVSNVELKRGGPSYSIDTLRHLYKTLKNKDLYFILGTENFSRITTWKDYEQLFEYSNFTVIARPGVRFKDFGSLIPFEIRDYFRYSNSNGESVFFQHRNGNQLIFVKIRGINLSSTKVRELVKGKKSIRYFVPDKLLEYIISNNLFMEE